MATDSVNIVTVGRKKKLLELPDGKHIELWALSISDWAFLEEEAIARSQDNLIGVYARNADKLPAEIRTQTILDAYRRAELITSETFSQGEFAAWLNTHRGNLTAVWLSMRHAQKWLTYDEASEIWSEYAGSIKEAADTVAKISRPTLGNESPPHPTAEAGAANAK